MEDGVNNLQLEEEMLSLVDTTDMMLGDDQDENIDDWDGRPDDEFEETSLVKSEPRRGRPSKRMLHPCDPNCRELRDRRSNKRFTLMTSKKCRRRAAKEAVREQMTSSSLYATSVEDGLPPDVVVRSLVCRPFIVELKDNGCRKYVCIPDEFPQRRFVPRRDFTPRDHYHRHPATPQFARR